MRLAGLIVLLAVAGCREAPPALTAADLQGDWILTGDSSGLRDVAYVDLMLGTKSAFTVQGDSAFDPRLFLRVGRDSSGVRAWVPLSRETWGTWTLVGDTLEHHRENGDWDRFERIAAQPDAPRPERIAIRLGGCYGGCPVMDAEIDSSGTFWYLEGDAAEPVGRFVAHDQYDVYDRLSTLAAGLRLDRPHPEVSSSLHTLSTRLVAWYGGEPHVFDGTADEFGPLLLIVAEMANAAWTGPMEESAVVHRFASRDVLDDPFLSYPEVIREVFGE
ncbi:MAG TPA: hypothetical protein VF594_12020 [Rubricoccaceae bacterium]